VKIGNVLSLFDGMSCGQLALAKSGIEYENYYASEVDKYAIKVCMDNHPKTIQLGDVRMIDVSKLPKIDLLIGGSPCQGFSFAGKQLNFDDPRSSLFFEYVRILREAKPKYFLLENVRMKKEYRDIITSYIGVPPVEINSALFSAQNRRRLYWTNIPISELPHASSLVINDILENPKPIDDYDQSVTYSKFKDKQSLDTYYKNKIGVMKFTQGYREGSQSLMRMRANLKSLDQKANCLAATLYKGMTSNAATNVIIDNVFRMLSTIECERLQTVPDNYTKCVSETQRLKMLGNGWTVNTVSHIFNGMKNE
jgi:DNA-cytosine methyltransferase